jgi:hypothetical protein
VLFGQIKSGVNTLLRQLDTAAKELHCVRITIRLSHRHPDAGKAGGELAEPKETESIHRERNVATSRWANLPLRAPAPESAVSMSIGRFANFSFARCKAEGNGVRNSGSFLTAQTAIGSATTLRSFGGIRKRSDAVWRVASSSGC